MNIGTRIMLGVFVLGWACSAYSYDWSCPSNARSLKNAAEEYEAAKSEYESARASYEYAKSSLESACNLSWGYSRDDESACGTYGYAREELRSAISNARSAQEELEQAADELRYTYNRVSTSCGDSSDQTNPLLQACLRALKKAKEHAKSCAGKK